MTMYCLYQQSEKTKWLPHLASDREQLIKTKKPALISVLNVDSSFDHDLSVEETRGLRYEGGFYVDFDAEDIVEATQQFKVFLTNLRAKDVDLEMLRLFATGKKGYHIEVPALVFMGKTNSNGHLYLPDIYREMAHALFVDTMDMRIYTSKRGRMWRCPNVKREDNGAYKVQLSAQEALDMDPDQYALLCSSPRNSLPLEPPRLNSELGLIFAQARDKVEKAISKKKTRKAATDQLQKYKGEWPQTLEGVLNGTAIKDGVGWNMIALQLAIVASELGKTEDQLLADAEGVIQNHESDSTRYNTPNKRRRDLRGLFRYAAGNPCLEYSTGGVLSLIKPDIRPTCDIALGEYVPEQKPEGEAEQEKEEEEDPTAPIQVNRNGIFVRTDDGYKRICDLGMEKPIAMCGTNRERIGYEVVVTLDGKPEGKKFLPMNAFTSKGSMNNWALTMGASMRGTDTQASSLADVMRKTSRQTIYAVEREGIDVVTRPGATGLDEYDIIWASPAGVVCNNDKISYRYHGVYSEKGTYKSDLMNAPALSLDDEDFVRDLLKINTSPNLAKMLGWFSAAFLTQLIRRKFKRFPSMQIFGQAGSGKSMTVILLNHMHYYLVEPRQFSVAGQTMFPIITAVATSASLPLVFEELKARQLTKHAKDFLQGLLRSNYTADQYSRGGLSRDRSQRDITVTDYNNAAPCLFVGEAMEDQAAILERCVVVALSKTDRSGRAAPFERCLENATHMGHIGKALAMNAMATDLDALHGQVTANFREITHRVGQAMADDATRPSFNLAVTVTGLDFLRDTLRQVFGSTFDERMAELRDSIMDNIMDSIPKNMSEASRVLDTMAALSRHADPQYQLVAGTDYVKSADGRFLDLKLRNAFDKYVKYQRSLGLEVLFDTHNTFQVSLGNYGGTVQRAVPDSPMWDSPRAVIYRLSGTYLENEGVDSFR
jgi:hypothetical protein